MGESVHRTSVVGTLEVLNVGLSSVLFVGDNLLIEPRSREFAVLRDVANYFGSEGDTERGAVFRRPAPDMATEESDVELTIRHACPRIQVDHIRVTSLSSAAVLQVGSTSAIDAETREKLVRQLLAGNVPRRPASPDVTRRTFGLAAKAAAEGMRQLDEMG